MSTFHLFLLPGLLAGESSELFLFQTYDTEFGTHCCFCKDWQEIEVVQSQGEAQTCFHPNLKHWEVMIWQRLFAELWWEGMVYPDHLHQVNVGRRGPHSHASSPYVSLIDLLYFSSSSSALVTPWMKVYWFPLQFLPISSIIFYPLALSEFSRGTYS